MPIGKISEFDVKNGAWSSYADRLEMYFQVNGVEEKLKLPTLIAFMGDEAYELLENLVSPKKPSELQYIEAREVLRAHLQPAPSALAERYRFRQRRQRGEEPVCEYVAELKKLARHCKFGNTLSENLRDQFVCGIASDVTRQRLFAEADTLTFADAIKMAGSLEAAERDAAAVEVRAVPPETAESSAVLALGTGGRGEGARRGRGNSGRLHLAPETPRSGRPGTTMSNCRGCGATSHEYVTCRYREFVCSRCHRRGHLRRVCMAGTASRSSRSNPGDGQRDGAGVHFGGTDTEPRETEQHDLSWDDCVDLYQLNL